MMKEGGDRLLVGLYRCPRCGSAGSIEFDMCQVCLYDFGKTDDAEVLVNGFIGEGIREEEESGGNGVSDRRALAGV